jgi:hypothetical protein
MTTKHRVTSVTAAAMKKPKRPWSSRQLKTQHQQQHLPKTCLPMWIYQFRRLSQRPKREPLVATVTVMVEFIIIINTLTMTINIMVIGIITIIVIIIKTRNNRLLLKINHPKRDVIFYVSERVGKVYMKRLIRNQRQSEILDQILIHWKKLGFGWFFDSVKFRINHSNRIILSFLAFHFFI